MERALEFPDAKVRAAEAIRGPVDSEGAQDSCHTPCGQVHCSRAQESREEVHAHEVPY